MKHGKYVWVSTRHIPEKDDSILHNLYDKQGDIPLFSFSVYPKTGGWFLILTGEEHHVAQDCQRFGLDIEAWSALYKWCTRHDYGLVLLDSAGAVSNELPEYRW